MGAPRKRTREEAARGEQSAGLQRSPVFSLRSLGWILVLAVPPAFACTVAVQSLRFPEDPFPKSANGSRPLAPRVSEALTRPQSSVLDCTLDEINAHLAHLVPQRWNSGAGAVLLRAGVRMRGEKGLWMSEHEVWGRRLMLRIEARVWVSEGRVQFQRERVHVGRMELSPRAAPFVERWLERVWPLLRKELALLRRIEGCKADGSRLELRVRPGTPLPETP